MEEDELPTQYDVIVVGTGLVECMVAAAAARVGKKVLHIDKNDYYGDQWASFTLKAAIQWAEEASVPPLRTPAVMCELQEGEELVATDDTPQGYSRVKQGWHVPEELPPGSSPEPPTVPQAEDLGQGEGTTEDSTPETSSQVTPKVTAPATVEAAPQEPIVDTPHEPSQSEDQEDVAGQSKQEGERERKNWSQEELMNLSRRFNLDLAPKLLYAQGPMVELLISSNIARYVEFKCITRILTWCGGAEGSLVAVPCSRSHVFTTSAVTLVEKRLLMKFLEFCHQFDHHPEQVEEYLNRPFVDFLRSRNLTDNLIHFVTEAIAMVGEEAGCREGLERTRAFLTSLGRYGSTPFLFSMYGSGELPQAFCRLCAVFEGIYVLRKPVASLVLHRPSNTCRGLLSEGRRYTCSHIVLGASHAPREYLSEGGPANRLSRAIFLTDRSILPHEKEQLTLLRLPAKGGNPRPVRVLEVGPGTHVCPKDLYCVHMTTWGQDAEGDLRAAVESLFTNEPDTCDKPRVLWSLYFNQDDYNGADLQTRTPDNLHLCPGPSADLDYDAAIEQARSIFGRMYPGDEFLPRAPDPDEIAFDNQGTEPKEGDTFEGNTTAENDKVEGEIAYGGDERGVKTVGESERERESQAGVEEE